MISNARVYFNSEQLVQFLKTSDQEGYKNAISQLTLPLENIHPEAAASNSTLPQLDEETRKRILEDRKKYAGQTFHQVIKIRWPDLSPGHF